MARISYVSLGCPKALVDSERIITRLRAEGYELSREHAGADLVIVNTCGFLDSAQAESLDAIGEALAENGKVVVTGCMGAEPEKITAQISRTCSPSPARSNTRAWSRRCIARRRRSTIRSSIWCRREGIKLTPRHYAYLKISEGCNNRCILLHHPEAARRSGLAPGRRRAARGRAAGRRPASRNCWSSRRTPRPMASTSNTPRASGRAARCARNSSISRASSASSAPGCGCTTSTPTRTSTRSSR